MTLRRRQSVAITALLAGLLAAPGVVATTPPADAAYSPTCGRLDRPETGVRGDVPLLDQLTGRADEGYNCGLSLVGYNSLGGRGGNANMAWAGNCAYVTGNGIAVLDVRDPTNPHLVRTLHGPGSNDTIETIAAIVTKQRAILVAGRYGFYGQTGFGQAPAPVDIYDVSDCRNPRLLSTFDLPSNAHNLAFSADGMRVWSTLPLQAFDITDPRKPRYIGNLEDRLRTSGQGKLYFAHEVWPSPDGRRIYVGGQIVGDEELLIIDVERWPARPARIVGRTRGPGHSMRPATINGLPYLLHSDESVLNATAKGCAPEGLSPAGGAAQPYLTDISDERHPVTRSKYRLPINEPLKCANQLASMSNASVHFHDVDNASDTTFAMLSMWNAGLRIVDVRRPHRPSEVAYFNPGRFPLSSPSPDNGGVSQLLDILGPNDLDQAWAHSRYVPETGHIWLATQSGGFWVLELEPQVRDLLGLPRRPARHPNGAPPRPASTRVAIAGGGDNSLYCTLNTTFQTAAAALPVRTAPTSGS